MAKSIFRTALDRVIEGRQRQADRYASAALLSLDDKALAALGTTREELYRKANSSSVF